MTSWQIQESIEFIKNDIPLRIFLDFHCYNIFAKRKMRGIYDHDKAIKDLNKIFLSKLSARYYNEKGNVSLYNLEENDKNKISETYLSYLEQAGGCILENIPLDNINGKIPLRRALDLPNFYYHQFFEVYAPTLGIKEKHNKKRGYSEIFSNSEKHHLRNKR